MNGAGNRATLLSNRRPKRCGQPSQAVGEAAPQALHLSTGLCKKVNHPSAKGRNSVKTSLSLAASAITTSQKSAVTRATQSPPMKDAEVAVLSGRATNPQPAAGSLLA